MSTLFSRE